MRGRRRVRDQTFRIAQVVGNIDQRQPVQHRERTGFFTGDLERHQGRTFAAHLAERQFMLWVIF